MNKSFPHIRRDIVGGLVSAGVAIPISMGYGMFAFGPLGENYFASGALAGLFTAFIVASVSTLLGDKSISIYAPRTVTNFFIGSLIYNLVHSQVPLIKSGGTPFIFAITFSILLMAGIFQALFGLVRLGSLIKFAPQPVMAGFQNAAAILLFLVQLGNVCGFDRTIPFTKVPEYTASIKPLSLVLAMITFVVMWNSRKIFARVPPLIAGISIGTALYYICRLAGFGAFLGPTIASDPHSVMRVIGLTFFPELAKSGTIILLANRILISAFALAIIASFDTLLCSKLITQRGERSPNSDQVLIRLGISNTVSPVLGGITCGLNLTPTFTNRAFGAQTRFATIVNAAAIFVVCTVLFPVACLLPRVALSAVLMVIAVQHIDAWSLRLVREIIVQPAKLRQIAAIDLAVAILVTLVSLTINIVLAVFVGIAIAVILFAVNMSRSTIRRSYRCGFIRSRKSRTMEERNVLDSRGDNIAVIELQGALFFGTGETVMNEIDALLKTDVSSIILDLRRIGEVDSTGALVILDIDAMIDRKEKCLFLVMLRQSLPFQRLLDFRIVEMISHARIFSDVDRAIEQAEDAILHAHQLASADEEIAITQIGLLTGWSEEEIAHFSVRLKRVSYERGSTIFREGDEGDVVYLVTKGSASVYLQLPVGETIRLATFGQGSVFGELALLDEGLRSASVVADNQLICYSLDKSDFAALSTEYPGVAMKLLTNLGRELSARLRSANRTIYQLEIF